MSQTRSLRRRLITTPMRDWVRGRLTGRMDLRAIYDAADLPGATVQLVRQVVKRTHLWRLEKADVAHELIAHFRDALEAGQSVEQAVADFGDPRNAAKLIRRAKKRGRSLAAKLWWRGWQAVGVLVLLYILAAVWLFLDTPRPTVDYVARFNAPAAAVPEQDRAWPIYREAWIKHDLVDLDVDVLIVESSTDEAGHRIPSHGVRPGDAQWPQAVALLREQADLLTAMRRGAAKLGLGLQTGFSGDFSPRDALALFGTDNKKTNVPYQPQSRLDKLTSQSVIGLLLPQLGEMRKCARMFGTDLRLAAEESDGDRLIADAEAMLGLAEQCREQNILINQLVGLSIRQILVVRLGEVLQAHPDLFNDEQWTGLAHRLSSDAHWRTPNFDGEAMSVQDMFQRIYGRSGRVTTLGLAVLESFVSSCGAKAGINTWNPQVRTTLIGLGSPVAASLIAPRSEMEAKCQQLFALMKEDADRPLRELCLKRSRAEQALYDLIFTPMGEIRYLPLKIMMPGFTGCFRTFHQHHAANQAMLVAIAAELYRRDTGSYPADLDALVPRYLPQAYPDESATSGSLLLTVRDGQLTVYGRGINGQDDGGVLPENYTWPALHADQTEGDWVLYPVPPTD